MWRWRNLGVRWVNAENSQRSVKDLTGAVRQSSLSAMEQTRTPTLIASVRRALHLMEAVAGHPSGAPAKRLARQVDLPLATVYHLLRTLAHQGYLIRTEDGMYVLGD